MSSRAGSQQRARDAAAREPFRQLPLAAGRAGPPYARRAPRARTTHAGPLAQAGASHEY